jgi:hypothetical protein
MIKQSTAVLGLVGLLCSLMLGIGAAHAQATRTWISGVGDDANPCSRTAPCKTWAGAISKTSAGGEIDCLDPGGFGALTITKSITLDCLDTSNGSILTSASAGININAGTNDVVNLIGLEFQGLLGNGTGTAGTPGTIGVNVVQAAKVSIVRCLIIGFGQQGVSVTPSSSLKLDLIDDFITNNGAAGVAGSGGVLIKPTGNPNVNVTVDETRISNNTGAGFLANGSSMSGGSVGVSVRNSSSESNTGNGLAVSSAGQSVQMLIDASTSNANGTNGIAASGQGATVRFTRSTITNNTTGVNATSPGVAASYGTNSIDGNGTPGTFTSVAQQ